MEKTGGKAVASGNTAFLPRLDATDFVSYSADNVYGDLSTSVDVSESANAIANWLEKIPLAPTRKSRFARLAPPSLKHTAHTTA